MRFPLASSLSLPVVAAPMFLISGPDLVIAACRSGVVGAFPSANCRTPADLDAWLGTIADSVGEPGSKEVAPWAINLVTHTSNSRLQDELRLVADHQPPIVITALGSPRPVMEVVKSYGGLVVADVVSLALARKAAQAGVDGLACISAGAGGHTGSMSPFAFISAVRDVFDGFVAVGGGIADGYGVAGALAAGADLVYMGTRFIATNESMGPESYKQMLIDHGPDDLVVSSGITGADASWLRPSLIANGFDPDDLAPLSHRDFGPGSDIKRWKDVWAAGQGLQLIREVAPVRRVVEQLQREYRLAFERIADLQPCPDLLTR